MSFLKKISLAVLSGLLLGAAWFSSFTFLIFIAWIPLLILTRIIECGNNKRPKGTVFLFSYLTFLIWNIIDTWWTWFASPGGAVFAILANALLMSTAYLIYFTLRRSINAKHPSLAVWLLIPVWLSFEYWHSIWDLAWSWLSLGNVLSFQHNWIQWYEFTGVSGGSLWILAVNILIYQLLRSENKESRGKIVKVSTLIILPILISFLIKFLRFDALGKGGQKIVIVQPNIDPYDVKFNSSYELHLALIKNQIKGKVDENTDYLVLPETFFTETVWENEIEQSYSVKFLRDSILKKYPKLIIITGANTYYRFEHGEKPSLTAHQYSDVKEYYDVFNTGIQLDNFGKALVYHKSKLVPGVERIPYPTIFKPLEAWAIDLGGTSGSLGTQEERDVFFNKDKTVGVAPVICFESVFGEYVTSYINNGANLIFIITNDGWWRDSPGKIQHLNYAILRAIETRCPIARCANTGISCFISPNGEISQATPWWEPAVISSSLQPNNNKTFFVRFGDLISKTSLMLAFAAIFFAIFRRFRK